MNQESFKDYKKKVYNPGSPHPNPVNTQYSTATPNPVNPLKVVFSSKRKTGESDTVGSESEPKRAKMMGPEELKQFTDSIIQQFKVSQDASNEALKKDLIQKMDTQASLMGAITSKIESISKNQEEAAVQAKADKEANDARFKSLEDRLSALENGSSSSIASDDG